MRNNLKSHRHLLHTSALVAVLVYAPVQAHAAPGGGVVQGGNANIQQSGATTTINQSSDRAIIRWDNFDVNAAEHVRFQQPSSSSITVNRITDSKASRIDGRLSANGNIVLINPNGVVFGASSVVDVGGLVATTSDLDDDDAFLSGGAVKFTRPGNADAKIINNGTMSVRDAGLAGLVAPHVENNGVIQARMGRVQLASGDIHTIDFAGDGLIKLEVSDNVISQSVANHGLIEADGGDVLVTAAQARNMVDALITNTGTIRANTLNGKAGSIRLSTKGLDNVTAKAHGKIIQSGALLAEGNDLNERGGDITILSDAIEINDGAIMNVFGDADGGSISVGGDYQGGNNIPTSDYTFVAGSAILNADSRRNGQGGRIVLWSDENTIFEGNASARGGSEGGDGGLIEVSGKKSLGFTGTVDLFSPHGENGTLLLDPTNITISAGADAFVSGVSPYTPSADNATSVLNINTLLAALASGNVIVQTRATGAQPGNITVDSAISWSSGNLLTLDAHGNIIVNQAISGANLTMIAGTDIQLAANVSGSGTLRMYAAADATTVGIGSGATGVFNINATDFPFIQNGWSDIVIGRTTATGAMDVRATTWNDNLTLQSGSGTITVNAALNAGTNNLTFTTNGDITIAAAGSVSGGGNLTLQQSTNNTAIGMGGTAGAINLTSTEVGRIGDGWTNIILGRSDNTATIGMGAISTWRDAFTILSNTGALNITGAQTFGANNVSIITDGDITLGITNSLYALGGTLSITQRSVGTTIGLGDSQTGDITLNTTEVTRLRDGFTNITIGRTDGTGAINVGTSTWLDNLVLQTGSGAINVNNTVTTTTNNLALQSLGGAITTTGAISQTTGGLNVTSGGGAINIGAVIGGTTTGSWNFNSGNGVMNINAGLTKTGGSVVFNTGTNTFTSNAALNLGAANTTITTTGAGNIAINNTVAQTTGNLGLTTAGGSIITNGSAVLTQTTGNFTANSNGGEIALGAASTQSSGASGNFTLNSGNGAITLNGTLTRLAGTTDINTGTGQFIANQAISLAAANGAITVGGASDIALNNTVSQTTGNLIMTTAGGDILGNSSAAMSQTTGNLTMNSNSGDIILASTLTQGGAAATGNLTLNSANGAITLGGLLTRLSGTTDINTGTGKFISNGGMNLAAANTAITTAGAGNIAINNTVAQTTGNLGLITAGGSIITSGAGALTQTTGNFTATSNGGEIKLGAASTQSSGASGNFTLASGNGAITLNGALTRLAGTTDINTGTGQFIANQALSFGAANAGITASGTSNIAINNTLAQTTGNLALTTSGGSVITSAASAMTQTTGNVTVNSNGGAIILGAASTQSSGASGNFSLNSNNGVITLGGIITRLAGALDINSGTSSITIPHALNVGAANTTITTAGGNIGLGAAYTQSGTGTLTLTSNGGSITTDAITQATGNLTANSSGGAINFGGTVTRTGGTFSANSGAGQMTLNAISNGAGALSLTTDSDIALNGNLNSTAGALTIAQASNNVSMGIGASQAGTVNIDGGEFTRIQDGWSSRTFGRSDSSEALNVAGGLNWTDTAVLQSGTGGINLNGAQTFNANSLTLRTDGDVGILGNVSGGGTFALVQSSAGTTMGVGDGQAGTVNLTTAERTFITDGWASRVFGRLDGAGEVNILGGTWTDPVTLRSGTGQMNINSAMTMGANNLTINTDSNLYVGGNVTGTEYITIAGASTATSIGLGDGQAGTILVDNAELNRLGTTWKGIIVGTVGMTGNMNLGARTWNDPLTLRTNTGIININGAQQMAGNALTISTDANLAINSTLAGTGTFTLAPANTGTSFGLGDGQAGTVSLTDAELNNIVDGWGSIVIGSTSGTGAINVGARTWNDIVSIRTAAGALNINGAQNVGANNMTLSTNSNLAINGMLTGTGTLVLTPSGNVTVGVGTGQAGAFALTDAELDNIATGWTTVVIGSATSTSAMNIAGRTWNNSMDFRTLSGALNINGAQNMGANNLTLRTATDLAIAQILAGTGTLTIMNSGTAAGNTQGIGDSQAGQLKITNSEMDFFTPYGWTSLSFGNTGSAGAINVAAHDWISNVAFRNAAGGVNINGIQNLSAGKNLTMTSNGDIAINNAINGTGAITIAPTSATIGMGVGTGQSGTVLLSDTELGLINTSWNDVILGTVATTTGTYSSLNVGSYVWGSNVRLQTSGQAININGDVNVGAHNLTILTDANLNINTTTGNLSGTGILTIAPQAAATNMGFNVGAGANTGTLNLVDAELQRITNGWNSIVFGRSDGTGYMKVGTRSWSDNVTFMTGSGLMTFGGANVGANNLTIMTNSNLALNGDLIGTGNLTIRNASGLAPIGVGDGQAGTLQLANSELVRLVDGWSKVTIGDANSFGAINIGAYNWLNPMTFVSQGDIVLNGAQTTTETSGTPFVFATTGGAFINNVGVNAVNPGAGRYLVYSVAEANDTLNGLVRPTILSNKSYSGYAPASVSETGNVFLYSGLVAKILYLVIDNVDKAYGSANPNFTYSYIGGLQNGDSLANVVLSALFTSPGSTMLDDAGTTRTITGSFSAGLGYTINAINGVLSVIKATLTVTGDSDTREYGDTNPGLTLSYSGFKNGDDVIDIDTEATAATAAGILSNVGNYAITASGAFDNNYDFVYVDGTLGVTKATINATTQNATRVYGDSEPSYVVSYTGFKNADTVTDLDTKATGSAGTTLASNVGNYTISGSGGLDNNYNFNYINTGSLSITKAMLTATTQNATRVYGDTNPGLTVAYTGFKNGEGTGVINTQATASTVATQTDNVGSYAITSTGASDNNYDFTYVNSGNLSITKAMLTATTQNATREYGTADPTFSVVYTGFKGTDGVGVINSQASVGTAATILSNVGSYAVTASGASDNNYDFTYANSGNLSITKAMLTATVQDATRVYGNANPGFSIVYTGYRNGDDDGDLTTMGTASSVADASSHVNTYAITGAGAVDNNYDFTYVNGQLSITKAMLTATTQNATRVYGDSNPALNISYTGFKNGESAGVIGTLATASTIADQNSNVGSYAITATGASDTDYDFTYVNSGNLAITKAMLTATAENKSRIYGDSNPGLTVAYTGFKNGEGSGVIGTLANATTVADEHSNVGSYAITATGASDNNYDFTYVSGNLAIGKATLTATAGSGTREYGAANPAFGVTYTGFKNTDVVGDINTLAGISAPGAGANVGTYTVTASGASDNNYNFNYVGGTLSVTKAMLTAKVDDAIRQVGTPDPAFNIRYTGFKNGENSNVINTQATATPAANIASPVGIYAIAASGALDNNYDFTYVDGFLTLTADPLAKPQTIDRTTVIPPAADTSLVAHHVQDIFVYPLTSFSFDYGTPDIYVVPTEYVETEHDGNDDFLIAVTEDLQSF